MRLLQEGGHRVVLFLKLVLYADSGPGGQFGAVGEKGVMQCPQRGKIGWELVPKWRAWLGNRKKAKYESRDVLVGACGVRP